LQGSLSDRLLAESNAREATILSMKYKRGFLQGKDVLVGTDIHKSSWTVAVICEGEIIYDGTM